MAESFNGGPVGLETLAAMTGEDPKTIEDICEPYLMQIGFIAKTPRGRILTKHGWEHLKMQPMEENSTNTKQMTLDSFEKE